MRANNSECLCYQFNNNTFDNIKQDCSLGIVYFFLIHYIDCTENGCRKIAIPFLIQKTMSYPLHNIAIVQSEPISRQMTKKNKA